MYLQSPWQQPCCKCHPRSSGSCVRCHPGGKCTGFCKNKNCRWNRKVPRKSRKKHQTFGMMSDIIRPCATVFGGVSGVTSSVGYTNTVYDAGGFSLNDQFMGAVASDENAEHHRDLNIEDDKMDVHNPELIFVDEDVKPIIYPSTSETNNLNNSVKHEVVAEAVYNLDQTTVSH